MSHPIWTRTPLATGSTSPRPTPANQEATRRLQTRPQPPRQAVTAAMTPTATVSAPPPTETPSRTPTITSDETATATSTSAVSPTDTPTPTVAPGETVTDSPTSTSTIAATDDPVTATATSTPTPTAPTDITATPTPTSTATILSTPTPTATAGAAPVVRLNEILPRPDAVDWDGNGQADAYDEWIEIVNLGPGVADLTGWALDDILGGGSRAFFLPPGTLLEPGGFLVRYRSTTGVALNQDADTANLLAPDGSVADSFSYTNPGRDASYSRAVDGTGDWIDSYPPSPGGPNLPGTPAPTGTPTPTRTPTVTPTPVGTLTPTPTAGPLPLVRLNEILPRPDAIDWDGNGRGTPMMSGSRSSISMRWPSTWAAGGWTTSPAAAQPTFSRRARCWSRAVPGALSLGHRRALNQDADTARLLAPDGREVDVFSYRNPGRDASYSRAVDGTGDWTETYPPSPGGPNLPGTPAPTGTPPTARRWSLRPQSGRSHPHRPPARCRSSGSTRSCPDPTRSTGTEAARWMLMTGGSK